MRRLDTQAADFEASFAALLSRAVTEPQVSDAVREIIAQVRRDGDAALIDLTNRFDRVQLEVADLAVGQHEIDAAAAGISPELQASLELAAWRIEAFHRAQ
jgi:histidinol dehydrogenase